MDTLSSKIAEFVQRGKARLDDPEFQANVDRIRRENAAAEAASRVAEKHLRFLQSGVPMSVWDGLERAKDTEALSAARWFVAEAPESCVFLALAGPAGRGKTFAGAWAVAEAGGSYAIAHDLVHLGTFDPIWRDLTAAHVLTLDELGREHANDAYLASLYTLLNSRHAHGRKTVLVTNLNADLFKARYCPQPDDPLRDRIRTGGKWLNLPGESLRTHWTEATEAAADREETEP
jgi:DNA replication protein DnaC